MSQKEKIINRYDKYLSLVKDLIKICDVCHIYDNSGNRPFRILKKRKEQIFYDECSRMNVLVGILKIFRL